MKQKYKKLASIEASKPELFVERSREACKRLADMIGEKYGSSPVQISDSEQASAQLVSVFERQAVFYGDRKFVVIDVLFNPAFLHASFVAKIAYDAHKDNVLAKFQRAGHTCIKHHAWFQLDDLAHDRKAISSVFRAYVPVEQDDAINRIRYYVFGRNDDVGQLNASDYASKQGVAKLLVQDLNAQPHTGRYGSSDTGEFVRRNYDWCDLNIDRLVNSAFASACRDNGLTQANIQHLVEDGLADAVIEKQLAELADMLAEQKEIEAARDYLYAAGYDVYANDCGRISIGPKRDHYRQHDWSELRRSKAMLVALAKALGVVQI